jgi:predicted TIM-barrel fold metal-dependent hydrolase
MHPPADMIIESFEKLVEKNKAANVDLGVLLVVDTETVTGNKISNDFMAEVMETFPEDFICYGSVDPHKGAVAVKELERIVNDLGLKGLKMFPSTQLFYPSDKKVYKIYEKAQELGVPIIFHSGAPLVAGTHRLKFNHPLQLDDVAIDFPDLKIVMGHMGNPWFWDTYALTERHKNLYFDISGRAREFLPHLPWSLFEKRISDKILFGTDMQHSPTEYIEEIRGLPISKAFKDKILGKNATKFLEL